MGVKKRRDQGRDRLFVIVIPRLPDPSRRDPDLFAPVGIPIPWKRDVASTLIVTFGAIKSGSGMAAVPRPGGMEM